MENSKMHPSSRKRLRSHKRPKCGQCSWPAQPDRLGPPTCQRCVRCCSWHRPRWSQPVVGCRQRPSHIQLDQAFHVTCNLDISRCMSRQCDTGPRHGRSTIPLSSHANGQCQMVPKNRWRGDQGAWSPNGAGQEILVPHDPEMGPESPPEGRSW